MQKVKLWIVGIAVCFTVFTLTTHAEDAKWYEGVTVNGFLSAAYSYNFNTPASGQNQFRVFDFDDNSFKVDVAEVVFQKPVAQAGDVGFRFDLEAGASIPRISAASGLFRNADGSGEDFDLQQAYISYIIPAGKGLRFDFGKFVTHTGMEVIEGYDGFNDNYSRSILFGYAIPFTHTGLKGTYAFSDKVTAMFMLANGWDNVKDNNRGKTFGGQLLLVPVSNLSLYFNYCGGPEHNSSSDMRNLFDFVGVYKFHGNMSVGLNYDYANDKNGVGPNEDATWSGVAGYFRVDPSEKWYVAVRAEHFNDDDAVRTGVSQHLSEFTFTPGLKLSPNCIFRGDLRFDHSDQDVFDDDGQASDNQTTIAFNALFYF